MIAISGSGHVLSIDVTVGTGADSLVATSVARSRAMGGGRILLRCAKEP